MRDSEHEGFRAGWFQDRRDSGQEGYMTGGIQDRRDAGHWTVRIRDGDLRRAAYRIWGGKGGGSRAGNSLILLKSNE